jgi:hypothetical protein
MRAAYSEEIAKAAVFLASDESSYVAGIESFVDGGAVPVWGRSRNEHRLQDMSSAKSRNTWLFTLLSSRIKAWFIDGN